MNIGIRVPWRNLGKHLYTYRLLFDDAPVEVSFKDINEFENEYIVDITSALEDVFSNILSLRIPIDVSHDSERNFELLEKAAYIASETLAENVVVSTRRGDLKETWLEKIHELMSSYKLRLCFDLSQIPECCEKDLFETLKEMPRGVFKICYNIGKKALEGLSEEEILQDMASILGLLQIIYLSNVDENGLQVPPLSFNGRINMARLLEDIAEEIPSLCLIIDHSISPEQDYRELVRLREFILSLTEKE